MRSLSAACLAAASLLVVASTAQAQGLHGIDWHGPGIFQGGDDDRTDRYVIGTPRYYYGGYGVGYPVYVGVPYGYGLPAYPYAGYGYGYSAYGYGYGYPAYGYAYPSYYWWGY